MLTGRWLGVELCQARYLRHRFPLHAHPEVHVALIEAGRYHYRQDGRSQVVEAGDLLFLPPDEPHDGSAVDVAGYAYRQILVPPRLWQGVIEEEGGSAHGIRRAMPGQQAAMRWLRAAFVADRDGDAMATDAALAAVILNLGTDGGHGGRRSPAPPRTVRRALDLMRERFADPLTLADLAGATGTSRFALARGFRRSYGIGIHEWLMALRLREAKRCLAQGMPAAEAAAANGFSDQSHLIRRFKRIYGVTPGQFFAACTSIQS